MKIKPYIITFSNNTLFGTNNDKNLIYNILYEFYINSNLWQKPEIITKLSDIRYSNHIILIYFSGHANKKGELILKNNKINYNIFKKYDNMYFIIDTCYSKKFIPTTTNSKNIFFIVSSNDKQKSKEVLKNDKPVSIFTYWFVKILTHKKYYNISDWKLILEHPVWNMVEKMYDQTIYYKEFI